MFGFARFLLAWFVVITHIGKALGHAGGFAVFAFYILSGFLMTLIMNERYGYSLRGFIRYCTNRSLRIYPQYWLVCTVTLGVLLFWIPEYAYNFHPTLRLPESTSDVLANIFIFGLFPSVDGNPPMPRLVPAAWALHVELVFYVLIGLFLGRSLTFAIIWFVVSAFYHVVAVKMQWPRYSPVYAASLAFSMGALLYHLRDSLRKYIPHSSKITVMLMVVYFLYVPLAGFIPVTTSVYPFYLNMVIFTVLLYQLSLVSRHNLTLRKLDRWFGDLSYPIYLNHWAVSLAISYLLGIELSIELLLYAIPIIFVVSWIFAKLIEDPIEVVRHRISRYSQEHRSKSV